MKALVTIFLSIFSASALADAKGFALGTSENSSSFSKCAAQEAVGATNAFTFTKLLYSEIPEGPAPAKSAYLFFNVKTENGKEIVLRLMFKTKDSEGWTLIQGDNGEIYPFANTIEPKALLTATEVGIALGSRDVSNCLN